MSETPIATNMPSILAIVVLFTIKFLEANRVNLATDRKLKAYYYNRLSLIPVLPALQVSREYLAW